MNNTLLNLIDTIDDLDPNLTIYIEDIPELSIHSKAIACPPSDDGSIYSLDGYVYLLEVELAKEVVEVWTSWRNGRIPSSDQKAEAVLYYGLNDAYLPLENGEN
jgi:hypothetical protein